MGHDGGLEVQGLEAEIEGMRRGTKSILFGVHQFIIHPIVVLIAWVKLYGRPNWKEFVCIIIHDWGYWGKRKMDDEEGERHPEWAARFALLWLDWGDLETKGFTYFDLCLYHSRHLAKARGVEPSRLCWADKLSILYEPWWFYLPRAWASGELQEYREAAAKGWGISLSATHREWYRFVQEKLAILAREQKGDAVPYVNQVKG